MAGKVIIMQPLIPRRDMTAEELADFAIEAAKRIMGIKNDDLSGNADKAEGEGANHSRDVVCDRGICRHDVADVD